MFENSPVTNELLEYLNCKFGSKLSWIALLKILSAVSCKLDRPRLSLMHVAPTRQGKTYTLTETTKILKQDFWIFLGSDWTMNSLSRLRNHMDRKNLMVNDAVVLFSSKAARTKDRLVGGLSELIADESYTYSDFSESWTITGQVTMNINITSEIFQHNKDKLFGSTFLERFLVIHHAFTQKEKMEWIANANITKELCYNKTIGIKDIKTIISLPSEYDSIIENISKQYSFDSLNSPISCKDLVIATLNAHAALNNRNQVCADDFILLKHIQPYLINPFSPYEGQIVRLRSQGFSIEQICQALHKGNYRQQVQRVIEKAELRGILEPPK